jgi:membrane fusion protein (multidrug efflux system)
MRGKCVIFAYVLQVFLIIYNMTSSANFVLTAAVVCLLSACGGKRAGGEVALRAYPAVSVGVEDVRLESVFPVTLKGREDVEIRPRVEGFIEDMYVDEGSAVAAGQALFKIGSPQAEQALEMAKAGVAAAEAQVNTALLNLNRMLPLAEKNIISGVQLDSYRYAYGAARAAALQAEAQLRNAEATVGWTTVCSPVSGVTGAVPYRRGSLVNSSNVLTTVANTSCVYAYFSLNEKRLAELLEMLVGESLGVKFRYAPDIVLTLAGGGVYAERGRIETVTGVLDAATGSAGVRVVFPNPQGVLRSGMSGRVAVPRLLRGALLIPRKATFAQQDKVLVYKIEGDSVVQRVVAVLATPDGRSYVVTGGLGAGDRIVADGLGSLGEGMRIAVEPSSL